MMSMSCYTHLIEGGGVCVLNGVGGGGGGWGGQSAYPVLEVSSSISGLGSDTVEALHFGHQYYFSMPCRPYWERDDCVCLCQCIRAWACVCV